MELEDFIGTKLTGTSFGLKRVHFGSMGLIATHQETDRLTEALEHSLVITWLNRKHRLYKNKRIVQILIVILIGINLVAL